MAEIVFDKVTKRYDDGRVAVAALDLTIADGEFVVLVGPSGCGKSTALRMVAGLEDISGGRLLIGGQVANDLAPRERNIAMVFQSYALYPHLTVAENIGFGLKVRGEFTDWSRPRCWRRREVSNWTAISIASRRGFRAVNASAWRWVVRSCASPGRS